MTVATVVEALDMHDAGMRLTSDGFLVAQPRIARSGIQIYEGAECGRPSMAQVRVYRPESEVFQTETLRSFAHRPVTDDHPPELINASNWKKYAIGQTGDEVLRDGAFIRVPMLIMDDAAIRAVKNGKKQLSAGYVVELVWGDGTTPQGEKYDVRQTTIRANHIAICRSARGGPMLRLGDSFTGFATERRTSMDSHTVIQDAKVHTWNGRGLSLHRPGLRSAAVLRDAAGIDDLAALEAAKAINDGCNKLAEQRAEQFAETKKRLNDQCWNSIPSNAGSTFEGD
jgi:hypothetical protein